jgi:hypothetical protein
MFSKPSTQRFELSRPLPQPVALTAAETKRVSGGGSNVQHGNPGGDTPIGNPGYGPPGGNGGASSSGGFDVHDHE